MYKPTSYNFLWVLIGMVWLGINTMQGQSRKLDRADKDYSNHKYIEARDIYLNVAKKGYTSEELFTRLGNSYYFNAVYDQALYWYEQLFSFTQEQPKDVWAFLRYAQALKANGYEEESKRYYDLFLEKTGRTQHSFSADDYLKIIAENSGRFELEPLVGLYDEERITYGGTLNQGSLYYTSTREPIPTFINREDAWSGLSFLGLYKVKIDSTNQLDGKTEALKGIFKSRFHDSSPVFTQDGQTVYFTRSTQKKGKDYNDQVLKIFRSQKVKGVWQKPEDLGINDDHFSTAHPALSPDERSLYFSSNRQGGPGQSDLYVAAIHSDGSLGPVRNLGEEINTSGRETFPYVTKDNELYFSSDGHFGLGGLDVFYVKIHANGSFGPIINVGEPVNSHADDFAFTLDNASRYGLVSSNRSSQSDTVFVRDNIYRFLETTPIKDPYQAEIEGYVYDKDSKEAIAAAGIALTTIEGVPYQQLETDEKGYYHVEVDRYQAYLLTASKEGYDPEQKQSEEGLRSQRIDFVLQNLEIQTGTDLAKVLHIPMIHFDFDKANIRPDAEVELQKVVAVMEQYPELKINIRSHTDSRGSALYNQQLSQRRAKSTYQYLVDKGIDTTRLTYEGLGESELLNGCSDGVPCTLAQHQENRRSEFIVVQ